MIHFLSFTLLFFSCYSSVQAGTLDHNQSCSQGENRLQAGTYQFWSQCNLQNWCAPSGVCTPKGCRKDDFPFGYNPNDRLPEKCPKGQFCPDEEDACQTLLVVGSPCQLNRDGIFQSHYQPFRRSTSILDQCEAPPNFKELADNTGRGLNFNGSVCLNNQCM